MAPGDADVVLLTGDNGAGKTNVLEALSLLAVGRGLRGAALSDMAQAGGGGGFAVAAALGETLLGTGTAPAAPERRALRVNGAAAPLGTLNEWLALSWLTPAMDRLFVDAASARRRFLDRLTLPLRAEHATHASRYEAAMRARTRLLTEETAPDGDWLAALEAAMAAHGVALHAARVETVSALDRALDAAGEGDFPLPKLALSGWEAADEVDFAAALRRARGVDAAAGRATVGPHRTDLSVVHGGKGVAAAQASTGEQKALLSAIILAHAELVAARRGATPILLLDEATAHLDARRRAALFARLARLGAQSWVTGTDAALFDGVVAARFRVAGGAVQAA
ncbi:DNA replication/repair protein RecF [Sandaracinobacteroides saxicola]|nr:DNA replication/repair protein RecF [Sandaracinobacteroides saxicola]